MAKGIEKPTSKRAEAKRGSPEPESERSGDLLDVKPSPEALRLTPAERSKALAEMLQAWWQAETTPAEREGLEEALKQIRKANAGWRRKVSYLPPRGTLLTLPDLWAEA